MVFEKNDIDLSTIKPRKDSAVAALTKLKESVGLNTKRAARVLSDNDVVPSEQQVANVTAAEQEFIDNLIESINNRLSSCDLIDNMSVFNMADTSSFYGNDEIMSLAEHFGMDADKVLEEWDTLKDTLSCFEKMTC